MSEAAQIDTKEVVEQIDYAELVKDTPIAEELGSEIEDLSGEELGGAIGAMVGRQLGERLGPQIVTAINTRLTEGEAAEEGESETDEGGSTTSGIASQIVNLLVEQLQNADDGLAGRIPELLESTSESSEKGEAEQQDSESEEEEPAEAEEQDSEEDTESDAEEQDSESEEEEEAEEQDSEEEADEVEEQDTGEESESDGGETEESLPADRDELEGRTYRELQSIARSQGVDARMRREELTETLYEALELEA